jgi:phosphoserine phosphatase RsbU/P
MDESQTHSQQLSCVEIWGGSQAFDNALAVPGIAAWVYSRPYEGDKAGGDVHYVSLCACGEIARFFLADISGHGASAGGRAADVRTLMRRNINTLDQTRFVRALNERMVQWQREGQFATAILTTYFAPTRQLLVCNAGHPPPLWYVASQSRWQWLRSEASERSMRADNPPVGIFGGIEFDQFAVTLGENDRILMFSDPLFEARDREGNRLGSEGLLRMMNEMSPHSPGTQIRSVIGNLAAHHGSNNHDDDLTILLLHHHGEGQVRKNVAERLRTMGRMLGLLPV